MIYLVQKLQKRNKLHYLCVLLGSKSGDYEEVRDHTHTRLLGNGTLQLQNVKEDREGFYLCQAENGIGTGIGKVIQLRVNCTYYIILRSNLCKTKIYQIRSCGL